MNKCTIILFVSISILSIRGDAEEITPIQKVSQTQLIECIDSIARGNVAAARVNVAHDAADNKVRIFAVLHRESQRKFKVSEYSVEIIYNDAVADEAKVGVVAYHCQHNGQVLEFAAAQFASGKKALGQKLVESLAEAQPDLFWSTPTHYMTIREILNGMNKDDETIKEFLKDESEAWGKHRE